MNGGVLNAAAGIFRLYASGKTFIATYKQGKKSWQTGEGWGKTFLLLGASILAAINLGQMASQGSEMMAADKAAESANNATDIASSNKSISLRDGEVIETPNGKVKITSMNDDGSINYSMKGTDGSVIEGRIESSSVDKIMAGGDEIKQKMFNNVAKSHNVNIDSFKGKNPFDVNRRRFNA